MIKKIAFALASSLVLIACGDDKSSSAPPSEFFSFEDSFEIVLKKAKYTYNEKDSTFKYIRPICKETSVGLVGPDDAKQWDTLSYKVSQNKDVLSVTDSLDNKVKYDFEDGTFPVGFASNSEFNSKKFRNGLRLGSDGVVKSVIRYNGSCLMKDYFSQFTKKNPSLENMDDKLTDFYKSFLAEGDTIDKETMLSEISAVNCTELSLFYGSVYVTVSDFKANSGVITVSNNSRTCKITFTQRYAYSQNDCEAAYNDYDADSKHKDTFNFEDYSFDVTYGGEDDDFCIDHLILELKQEKGKKVKAKAFATGLVNLVVGGMK